MGSSQWWLNYKINNRSKSYNKFTGMNKGVICFEKKDIHRFYSYNNIKSNVKILAYEDRFITHGDVDELYKLKSMDTDSISKKILKELEGI